MTKAEIIALIEGRLNQLERAHSHAHSCECCEWSDIDIGAYDELNLLLDKIKTPPEEDRT